MEQLDYNLLFRWFVGFGESGQRYQRPWDVTAFTKNTDGATDGRRSIAGDAAGKQVLRQSSAENYDPAER